MQLAIGIIPTQAADDDSYWEGYTVLANQLKVRRTSQIPSFATDSVHAPVFVSFTPLNSQKLNDTHILYRSEAVLQFRYEVATNLNIDRLNTDGRIDVSSTTIKTNWGRFFFCTDFNYAKNNVPHEGTTYSRQWKNGWISDRKVDIQTPDIYIPDKIIKEGQRTNINGINYGFNTPISFSVELQYDTSDLHLGGTTISMKNERFYTRIAQIVVQNPSISETNKYRTVYIEEFPEIGISAIANSGGSAQSKIQTQLEALSVGVTAGNSYYDTILQGTTSDPGSAVFTKTDENAYQLAGVSLTPDVKQKRQQYTVNWAEFDVDTENAALGASPAGVYKVISETYDHSRSLGFEIKNYKYSATMRVAVELFSLEKIDVQESTGPKIENSAMNITSEDYYWDNLITGQTNITTKETDTPAKDLENKITAWFKQYGPGILVVVIIVAIIAIVVYIKVNPAANAATQMLKSTGADTGTSAFDNLKNIRLGG